MKRLITLLFAFAFCVVSPAAGKVPPTPVVPTGPASTVAGAGAEGSAAMTQYLMGEAAKTDDPSQKAMLMMMMMQSMQQQQASQKASKKNKENEDKKEEKSAAEKMPTPGPLPSMAPAAAPPQENLKLVEEAAKQDEAERAKKAEAEKEKSDPIADMLVPFTPPKVDLGLNKPSPTPAATEEKETPSMGPKTALGAITPPKGENLNFANGANGNANDNGLGKGMPSVMGARNSNPAQEVVGAERGVASAAGEESAKGNVRKTTEQAAGGDGDGGSEGGNAKGEGSGSDDLFASLMAKMNGEDAMMAAEGSGMGSEGDAAAGESAPMSIFEFASMRYRKAANEDGRLRPMPKKNAEAAMR